MLEKFEFTWAQLRDTEVMGMDGTYTTVGEVLAKATAIKLPDGRCKVNWFDFYKCSYLLKKKGIVDTLCDYKLGWSSYATAIDGAIKKTLKELLFRYTKDSVAKDNIGIVKTTNPFDFTVTGGVRGYFKCRPLEGFWEDSYVNSYGEEWFGTLGFEESFLVSNEWFEDYLAKWVLTSVTMSIWWELKTFDEEDYVAKHYNEEEHGNYVDYVSELKREVLLMLARVETAIREAEVDFTTFEDFEDLCRTVSGYPNIAFYFRICYVEPIEDGWYKVVMNLQTEDYVNRVVEFKIQWSGDLMKDGGVYKLSDIFEKRIRW